MNDAQIQLQNALTTTFLGNLAFLSEYDNDLFHRIDELSRMIEDGSYKERYALDFVQENGEFDIYDLINNRYLYNKIPKRTNDDLIKCVEFDEKDSIFMLESIFTIRNPIEIDDNQKFDIQDLIQLSKLTQKDVYSYTNILKDFLEHKKKRLKRISKFIFIGTLLGRHIPKIATKIDADLYLVCERNLEIFRLSLFTVDYTVLAKKNGVIFSIMDEVIDEEKKIFNFLSINPLDNYLIKFSTTGINIHEYIDRILSSFMSIKPTSYDYNRYLYTFINRATKVLESKYRTLLINKVKNKINIFENIPILFIAAGPSLDENIEWIRINQDKFFIVTIGAAYKKLLRNNVKINMIFTLDEQFEELNKNQFDDYNVSLINSDTIIMASVITDNRILKKFKQSNLFLYEVFIPFHKDNYAVTGFSVGEITLFLLLNMNIKDLYLVGLDMALNQNTGNSHSTGETFASSKYDLKKENKSRDFFGLREGTIKVKGNLEKEVYTTALYHTSIKYVEKFMAMKNVNVNVYNLSTHGAYFENSIPKRVEEIKISSFERINLKNKDLLDLFQECSSTSLCIESKENISEEIRFLKNILEKEFVDFIQNDFKDYDEFFKSVISLISLITDYEFIKSSIAQILRNYLQIIFPYLSYHFNDIKVKNENKNIEKIKKIFVKQIEQLINDYIGFLEKVEK
ncbi:MAG: DUF115 domain-containing protein [Aliarcobacter sp.]|nr:DUF115 domain-containing protein [Aliarcobacter sp.]